MRNNIFFVAALFCLLLPSCSPCYFSGDFPPGGVIKPDDGEESWDDDMTGGNHFILPEGIRDHLKEILNRKDAVLTIWHEGQEIRVEISADLDFLISSRKDLLPKKYLLRIYTQDTYEDVLVDLKSPNDL